MLRYQCLHLIANNARFLILPGVRAPKLALRVLGLCLRRLSQDWQVRHAHSVLLAEIFVEVQRFTATCYGRPTGDGWVYQAGSLRHPRPIDSTPNPDRSGCIPCILRPDAGCAIQRRTDNGLCPCRPVTDATTKLLPGTDPSRPVCCAVSCEAPAVEASRPRKPGHGRRAPDPALAPGQSACQHNSDPY